MRVSIRAAMAAILVLSVPTLAGCAKSISVSPQQVVLTAAQPSAQVTVEMKWPHTVAWQAYVTDPGTLLVTPDSSYDESRLVTVTASDFAVMHSHQVSFVVGDTGNVTALLDVIVQAGP